jgi:hypothetical protein
LFAPRVRVSSRMHVPRRRGGLHPHTLLYPRFSALPSPLGEGAPEGRMRRILREIPRFTPHPDPLPRERESAALHKTYPHPLHPVGHWLRFSGREARAQSLVPGSVRSLSAYGGDSPILRQGVRHGRGALNDRPHLPVALESGARASGKTPRAGCLLKLPLSIQRFIGSGRHPAPSSAQTVRRQASWRSRCLPGPVGAAYPVLEPCEA